jgi:hypothetical protein
MSVGDLNSVAERSFGLEVDLNSAPSQLKEMMSPMETLFKTVVEVEKIFNPLETHMSLTGSPRMKKPFEPWKSFLNSLALVRVKVNRHLWGDQASHTISDVLARLGFGFPNHQARPKPSMMAWPWLGLRRGLEGDSCIKAVYCDDSTRGHPLPSLNVRQVVVYESSMNLVSLEIHVKLKVVWSCRRMVASSGGCLKYDPLPTIERCEATFPTYMAFG